MLGGLLEFEIDTAAISQPAGDRKLATVFFAAAIAQELLFRSRWKSTTKKRAARPSFLAAPPSMAARLRLDRLVPARSYNSSAYQLINSRCGNG
jgi:hypothetical protein